MELKDSRISFAELPLVGSRIQDSMTLMEWPFSREGARRADEVKHDSKIQRLASLSSLRSVQRFKKLKPDGWGGNI
jgi:hypothetical protein